MTRLTVKRVLIIGIIGSALLVLGFGSYWWWGMAGAAKAQAIAREAGLAESPDEVAPPPVPPEDDPEPLIFELARLYESITSSDLYDDYVDHSWDVLSARRTTRPALMDDNQAERRRALLDGFDEPPMAAIMETIEAIAAKPGYAATMRWSLDTTINCMALRHVLPLLGLRAWLRAEAGNTSGATEDLLAMMQIDQTIRQPRQVIVMFIHLTLGERVSNTWQRILMDMGAETFSAAELERLHEGFQMLRHPADDTSMSHMISADYSDMLVWIDKWQTGRTNLYAYGEDPTLVTRFQSFMWSPMGNRAKLRYTRAYADALMVVDLPLHSPQYRTVPVPPVHRVDLPWTINFDQWKRLHVLHDALAAVNVAGLRLLLGVREQDGAFPDTLPADYPLDPFTGKRMHYERTADGFRIWCETGMANSEATFTYSPHAKAPADVEAPANP